MEAIGAAYSEMRSKQSTRNLPVTARSLETIIRLASAHAKSRLSNTVEETDVEEILDIINFVMFHEVGKDHDSSDSRVNISSKRKIEDEGDTSNDDDYDENDDEVAASALLKRARQSAGDSAVDESISVDRESVRYHKVLEMVKKMGDSGDGQSISMDAIMNRLNENASSATLSATMSKYSVSELNAILSEMEKENKIMFDDGEVFIM